MKERGWREKEKFLESCTVLLEMVLVSWLGKLRIKICFNTQFLLLHSRSVCAYVFELDNRDMMHHPFVRSIVILHVLSLPSSCSWSPFEFLAEIAYLVPLSAAWVFLHVQNRHMQLAIVHVLLPRYDML